MLAIRRGAVTALCLALLAGPAFGAREGVLPEGPTVQLSDVPAAVLAAARKELEVGPTAAKTVTFEGQPAYLIEGTNRYDKHLSVIVAADGKILLPVNIWDADDD